MCILKYKYLLAFLFVFILIFCSGCSSDKSLTTDNYTTYKIEDNKKIQEKINKASILNEIEIDKSAPTFLNSKQSKLFEDAIAIYEELFVSNLPIEQENSFVFKNEVYFKVSQIKEFTTFEEFDDYLETLFTDEWINKNVYPYFIDRNGDIYTCITKDNPLTRSNIYYKSHSFIAKSIKTTSVQFDNELEFFENLHSSKTTKTKIHYKMILDNENWIFSNFNVWY